MADRLISADALKELIADHVYPVSDVFNSRGYGMFWTGGIEKAIDDTPTVDAVEVVRCRDCQWFDDDSVIYDGYCDKNGLAVDEDDFCAWAARREER